MSCYTSLAGHDAQMAHFNISAVDNHLKLEMVVDREDLELLWGDFYHMDCDEQERVVMEYMTNNIDWFFNQQKQELCDLENARDDYGHISFVGSFYIIPSGISTIEVFNRCFITEIPRHINLINVDLHNSSRTFRMDESRTRILVDY